MKKSLAGWVFFIGWLLSPFTWWNDAFINIPLSYLVSNILFYTLHLPFNRLVITSYWFTNILGLLFLYFGGRDVLLSKNKLTSIVSTVGIIAAYSVLMLWLDKYGKLPPIGTFFR